MVVVRATPEFAANPTEIIPVPLAFGPGLTNESAAKTWYGQPACVTTSIGKLLGLAPTDDFERLTSYVHPFNAGMLSTLSRNRVPKYFRRPEIKAKYAPPGPADAGICTSR